MTERRCILYARLALLTICAIRALILRYA